ncbi:hypothetical protein CLV41_107136 [Roseibium marinum]|uniref:Uncharacterized protein n=1 Tax=Roseibium marinum TaxID=281252 RepID=A0A2S3URJ5_9HYPH|nr:hypothetical protein CLV41_107136 [Roseibium marinum]
MTQPNVNHKAMAGAPVQRILVPLSRGGRRQPAAPSAVLSNLNPSIWETYYV